MGIMTCQSEEMELNRNFDRNLFSVNKKWYYEISYKAVTSQTVASLKNFSAIDAIES